MAIDASGNFDTNTDPIVPIDGPPPTSPSAPAAADPADAQASLDEASGGACEGPASAREKSVPLAEAIRLRRRAQEAEAKAGELSARVGELERLLAQAREALDSVERRRRVDLALLEADAVDLESARLLTELALGQMERPDEAVAVGELRRRKPFMFRTRRGQSGGAIGAGGGGTAMSARTRQAATDSLLNLAEEAARTGDRRALLRYLQARRARERGA